MERIYKNDKTIKYVEDAKDIQKFLPDETVLSVRIIDKDSRKLLYKDSGWYYVEKTCREKGIYEGNICPMCEGGEMVDMGGCMTCNNCMAQLKCGL